MVQQDRVDPAKGSTILRLSNISKNFGAVSALTDIDLEVRAGEVVALVGDNGAGKSTLIKVLAGVHQPSSGRIEFCGQEVSLHSPSRALELGIATVFQDLALCENLDVVANLFLGHELSPWNLDEVAMEVRAWTLLRELAARIPSVNQLRLCRVVNGRPSPLPDRCSLHRRSSCSTSRLPHLVLPRRRRCST